ncbi:MAG: aminopeptidase PepB [Kangiellaceae bacterium]|jgi:PepB aminopeptidase|nr:aminopeptidase PepB [Kangiellaceae bacterium]
MAKFLQVALTNEPAEGIWTEKSLMSFDQDIATIHFMSLMALPQIQAATRQLISLGFEAFKLVGDEWGVERQFAFAQAAFSPKFIPEVIWAPMDEANDKRLQDMIAASYWTRTQVNRTPEDLSPLTLAQDAADFISSLAPDNVSFSITSGDELLEQGLVGIHGVGRGSVRPGALLQLDFTPEGWGDAAPAASLVGKGITFDSGGYSLKASESMLHMKGDMGGAATVTGALALAIAQGLDNRVSLILCCAENLVSGHAYKLGDILTYKNGTTVEIVNTDAEGRLVLADGLILASETGAELIVDAATLTGAAVAAVGDQYNAIFSFDEDLRNQFLKLSSHEFERHWPLPLDPFHVSATPSSYADTANSRPVKGGGPAGASNAAGFLSRFVAKGRRWLHIDLAACMQGTDSGYLSAGGTGAGVRSIAKLLLEQ